MLYFSKELRQLQVIEFLEFEIKNTSDGLVLYKKDYDSATELWKCHLGNFSTIKDAKCAAIVYWMISRPEIFGTSIFYRVIGSGGTHGDFFLLRDSIRDAGYEFPKEIAAGGESMLIYFDGNHIKGYWKK